MARQSLNNGVSGKIFRDILNANFIDLYSNKADTNHASSGTNYGVASTTEYGHVKVTRENGLSVSNGILSMATATTSSPGAVLLVNNATTDDSTSAVTASALREVSLSALKAYSGTGEPNASLGKEGDLYIKTE